MKFDDHDNLSNEEFNSDEDKYKEDRGKPALFEHTESGIWTEVISRRRAIVKNTNMYQHIVIIFMNHKGIRDTQAEQPFNIKSQTPLRYNLFIALYKFEFTIALIRMFSHIVNIFNALTVN